MPGVRHVESRSRPGISAVQVWFNYDADLNAGQNEIIQRIQQISNTLPSGIKQPFIVKFDLSNIPVCLITVSGGGLDEKQLYDLAYNTIEPQIERITGVASAGVDGGKIRQIAVNLDRDLLYAKAISVLDVVRSVNDANFLMPSGVRIGTVDYKLLTNNQFQLVDRWRTSSSARSATSRPRPRSRLRVRLARGAVERRPRQRRARRVPAGEQAASRRTPSMVDAVKPSCRSSSGAARGLGRPHVRPVDLHPPVDQQPLARVPPGRPAGVPGHPAVPPERCSTGIIFVAIPLSILCTLIAMLSGPDAEHLHARRARRSPSAAWWTTRSSSSRTSTVTSPCPARTGTAVLDAAREVAMPIFVSTITTIVVFLPTIFLEGQSKLLFIPADLHHLVLAVRVVPGVADGDAAHVPPAAPVPCGPEAENRRLRDRFMRLSQAFFDRLDAGYQDVLQWALGHRKSSWSACSRCSWQSLGLVPLIGSEFFPASDESQFRDHLRAPIGTRVEETEKVVARVEQMFRQNLRPGELQSIVSTVGIPAGRSAFTGNTGPARRAGAGVPVHAGQADAERRPDRGGAPAAVRRGVPRAR